MSRMSTKTQGVLQVHLVLTLGLGLVIVILQANPAVFTMGPLEHAAIALGCITTCIESCLIDQIRIRASGLTINLVIAKTRSPLWPELVNRLRIESTLLLIESGKFIGCRWLHLFEKVTIRTTVEVLKLQFEVAIRGITIRGPLIDGIQTSDVLLT
jgi:hypothetical protein